MLTSQQDQDKYTLAKQLLTMGDADDKAVIESLRQVINWADKKYYVDSEPILADQEYDSLFKKLVHLETLFPNAKTEDSPTQRIAYGISEKFPAVSHLVPMLSLENTYNAEDLYDWDRKVRESAGDRKIAYCVEPKYDGASISLVYNNGKLSRGATRGDGVMGEEITTNIRQIRSVPMSTEMGAAGIDQIEVRGEVVIHKNVFAAYNAQRTVEGLSPLANPRNAASGTLRMLDAQEVAKRKLSAILYSISYVHSDGVLPEVLATHYGSLQWLDKQGFPTPIKQMQVFDTIEDVIRYCDEFELKRDDLPFEIDGLVIKVNSLELQDALGMTSHHPRWAVAYKFKARQATSKLLRIEYQVGRTGSITPVAKIEPVAVGGVTISSLSLFNEDVIREKDIMLGDTVLIERAGDVIPYVVKSITELRKGNEEPIVFPTHCPVCNSELEKPDDEAVWRCVNVSCPAQAVERIIHFASKDAMDIRNLGDANIRKFYDQGILTSIPSIYTIDWSKIEGQAGFGAKSIANMQSAIEQSKSQPLHRLIFGLGIRHVGETTAKTLAAKVAHLTDFYQFTEEQLIQLEDIGPKVAASITHFFAHEENRSMIAKLEEVGVNLANQQKSDAGSGIFEGKTFLFTGTLSQLKRSDAEAMVEANGGKLLSGVSSKLNYLVVGEDAGSKLEKAKKLASITILTEEEFLLMMQSNTQS